MFYQNLYNLYITQAFTQTRSLTSVCQTKIHQQNADYIVMTQILNTLPTDCAERILCCYINKAHKVKLARIMNISN